MGIINLMEVKSNLNSIMKNIECILEEVEEMGEMAEDLENDYTVEISDSCCYSNGLIDCMMFRLKNVKDEFSKGIE